MIRRGEKKRCLSVLVCAVALLSVAAVLPAQAPGTVGSSELSQAQLARAERIQQIAQDKSAFVNEQLGKWAEAAAAKGYDAFWQKGQRNLLTRTPAELLDLSERATDFDTFDKLVFRGFRVNALGDLTQDLVFFPLTPCRLLDSRIATLAQYQGPKAPGTEIAFSVNDSLGVQGGNAVGCGVPIADPPALAVVVTAVPSNTLQGNLRAYPTGGAIPTASLVNYEGGVVVASGAIAQSCTACGDELTVRDQGAGSTHIVVDVTGYFAPPNATALECLTTAAGSTTVAAGAIFSATPPACAAGYKQVSVSCRSTAYNTANWAITGFFAPGDFSGGCWGTNIGGGNNTFEAYGRCCRIPGQ
jgi:hypothetical protein